MKRKEPSNDHKEEEHKEISQDSEEYKEQGEEKRDEKKIRAGFAHLKPPSAEIFLPCHWLEGAKS